MPPRDASILPENAVRHVQAELDRQVVSDLSPAIGVAISVDGGDITSLYSGAGRPGSRFRAFSCGKPLAAAVLWRLHDRGLIDWNAPISEYWPEFAANGKSHVTVDHVLTHRAGLPSDPQIPVECYGDWQQVIDYLEDAPLEFAPGQRMEYHSLTFGWLVGELASRISGKSFEAAFAEEVAAPLGLTSTSFAPVKADHDRVLPLHAAIDFESPGFVERFDAILVNRVLMPGGSCISTPEDIARFYSTLLCEGRVDGNQWLSPETVREVTAERASAVDPETGILTRRTLGMALPGVPPNTYACPRESPTFGHGGAGTSTTWGDPSTGIAATVFNTGLQPRERNRGRLNRASAAIREAVRIGN